MPTPTYDLIASNVLTSDTGTLTFSSIPATYRDLVIVVRMSNASVYSLRFNGDSGLNYHSVAMTGFGTTATSSTSSPDDQISISYNAPGIVQILDYSATDKHKSVLARADSSATATQARAGRWANTAAINSITFTNMSSNSGSSFYLYGISA